MYLKIYGEHKVDFDDDIIHAIVDLNMKGFVTKYCCSGHVKGNGSSGYVYFEKQLLKKYGIPIGWYIDEDYLGKRNTIRYDFPEGEKKQDFINRKIKNLEKWIKTLPTKKYK